MPIVRVDQGDLIAMFKEKKFQAIAHGCNCHKIMGAGIAGQIVQQFPEAREADQRYSILDYESGLGTWSQATTPFGLIVNVYTQKMPGKEVPQVLYPAIRKAFYALDVRFGIGNHKNFKFGIPMIGSGIAGGDWKEIEKIINEVTPNLDITLVKLKDANKVKATKRIMNSEKRTMRSTDSIVELWN